MCWQDSEAASSAGGFEYTIPVRPGMIFDKSRYCGPQATYGISLKGRKPSEKPTVSYFVHKKTDTRLSRCLSNCPSVVLES